MAPSLSESEKCLDDDLHFGLLYAGLGLDSMILVGTSQLRLVYDSMTFCQACYSGLPIARLSKMLVGKFYFFTFFNFLTSQAQRIWKTYSYTGFPM